ncbi:hypothetical protein [Risungbinella massiliensis]|uniref:hypothetical protein n=1 Tax=Risungbinella massiliensis TaxID=1329796 RepID=UPI0005CC60C4|nr:hypothetical protein [Risungbinella massiliensis]
MMKKIILFAPFVVILIFGLLIAFTNLFIFEPTYMDLQKDAQEFIPRGAKILTHEEGKNLAMWDMDEDQIQEGIVVYEHPKTKQREVLILKKKVIGYDVTKFPISGKDPVKETFFQDVTGDRKPELVMREQKPQGEEGTEETQPEMNQSERLVVYQVQTNPKEDKFQVVTLGELQGEQVLLTDLDNNGINEAIVIEQQKDAESYGERNFIAKLYQSKQNRLELVQTMDLGMSNWLTVYYSPLDKTGRKGLILDKQVGVHSQTFSLIVMKDGQLVDTAQDQGHAVEIYNNYPKSPMDINKDGILDIPFGKPDHRSSILPLSNAEMRYIYEWQNFIADNRLVEVSRSISGHGFDWIVPEQWKNISMDVVDFDTSRSLGTSLIPSNLDEGPSSPFLVIVSVLKKADLDKYQKKENNTLVLDEFEDFVFVGHYQEEKNMDHYPNTKKIIIDQAELKKNIVLWEEEELKQALGRFDEMLELNIRYGNVVEDEEQVSNHH